jgi:hypothetical protein
MTTTQLFRGGGGGCFKGDVPVRTANGDKRIDEITVGESVYCFDDKGNLLLSAVLAVHEHENESVSRYTIWGGQQLDSTPNHWVLNQFNAFVAIGTLGPDDCLIDENNHLRPIVKVEDIGKHTVYNLTVEKYHTFIAGGIRVHNAGLGLGRIAGAGGGSKSSGGSPDTENDNLNSRATVYALDLVSEGEIEGFPSARDYERGSNDYNIAALKDIFLDGVAILRSNADPANPSDNDYNFKKSEASFVYGTVNQSYIEGFEDVTEEVSVGQTVYKDYPVERTIVDTNVDSVRVTLSFPALQEYKDNGDIEGAVIHYKIDVAGNGGSYVNQVDKKLEGRTGDLYQKSHKFSIAGFTFPVTIRVKRTTKDSDSVKLQNEIQWYSYTEITSAKLRYPNSALVGLVVDSKEFSSIPARTFRIRGIQVSIPSNATVDKENGRLTYEGVWDGTFGAQQWCTDPAWCLWDLLTNCRYGFGQHIKSTSLDKFSFYQASQYCSELVPDGKGGEEPRFSCNVVIQNQEEAYKLINSMCSVFRAMPYWSSGSLSISQDRPTDATLIFNQTNITEEGFQYSGSSLKTRHTVAIVSYLDLEAQELAYEAVEDPGGIAKYGVITTQVEGFAVTSQAQAHRLGEWLLYSEQNESETCTFKTSLKEGCEIRPGMVVGIIDPVRTGVRRGGRISSATTTKVRIDSVTATNLPTGGSPTLLVSMPDGTIQEKGVASISGDTITVSSAFSTAPLIGGVFIYNNNEQAATYWRVLSVKEEEPTVYAVTALSYIESKYDYIERDLPLEQRAYLPIEIGDANPPSSISTQFVSTVTNGVVENKTYISWPSDPNVYEYNISYKPTGSGNWSLVSTPNPSIDIPTNTAGTYDLSISAINAVGKASASSFFTFSVSIGSNVAEDVTNLDGDIVNTQSVSLSWNQATSAFILNGGHVLIRHQAVSSGATWENSTELISPLSGSTTSTSAPLLSGTYLVKFETSSGVKSTNAAMLVVDAPVATENLLVL